MKERKVYDRDFKVNAVKLSYERDNLGQYARELGISVRRLYSWRSQYKTKGAESFPGNGNQAVGDEAKELLRMKKENSRLRQELEILKKALGIISKSDL